MEVVVSGSANRIAYAEGEKLLYLRLDEEPPEWKSAPLGHFRHVFLSAGDIFSIEVEKPDDAIPAGRLASGVSKALSMLDIMLLDPDEVWAGFFAEHYAKQGVSEEVDRITRDNPMPDGVTPALLRGLAAKLPAAAAFLNGLADFMETGVSVRA